MTTDSVLSNEQRQAKELEIFDSYVNVHALPDIFHYWSNKYLRPILEEYGIAHPDDFFVDHMLSSATLCNAENPVFISIGSGNCDTEVRLAKRLKERGLLQFCIECLDLNPTMLQRGRDLAIAESVIDNLSFIEQDFNKWKADKQYTSVIAVQSLHHIQNLEGVFSEVKASLHENGSFITNDMIGRNGHQRWPEALSAVHKFWRELPEGYKYNHQLRRHEEMYENWDCSTEGFEGVRAQDILPLLVKNFHFRLFIAYSNVVDVFIDRGFGPNFDACRQWDKDFVDRVHRFDEESIQNGSIKPTHMMAVMRNTPVTNPDYSRGLTPESCVRDSEVGHDDLRNKNRVKHGRIRSLISRIFN